MKGVPAVETGDIGMSYMCNTDSVDEKLQKGFQMPPCLRAARCYKVSSWEVGWREREGDKANVFKTRQMFNTLDDECGEIVDLGCWRIPQFVGIKLERSALRYVVKTPSSSLENTLKLKVQRVV